LLIENRQYDVFGKLTPIASQQSEISNFVAISPSPVDDVSDKPF
jgi:hypothetical protein